MEGGLKSDHLVPNFCIWNDKHTGSSTDADSLLTLVVTAIGSNLAFLLEIPFAGPSHQRFHNPARAFHGLCTYPVYTNEVLN